MSSAIPSQLCPCGSKVVYASCCQPFHLGTPAPTAEKLMRSRYCAFAHGEVQYLVDTQHPETRESDLFQSLDMYTKTAQFLELKILKSSESTVEFIATVIHEGNLF
ncbi:MAG: SEC-C domain-containing protein, partial [Lentisphaeraceae bacterium]|nr:SEC-C domain-containing protein [Lentisphaeraceae bacterium]